MLFYSSKLFMALTVSSLILTKGTIGGISKISSMIPQDVAVTKTDNIIVSSEDDEPLREDAIGTGTVKNIATPTPEPTPTPTPEIVKEKTNNSNTNSLSNNSSSNSNSTSNSSAANSAPAPAPAASGSMMFYFSSYGDDAEATFNACVAEANRHGTASCDVAADDSGYLLTYSG